MSASYLFAISIATLYITTSTNGEWEIAVSTGSAIELLTHRGELVTSIGHSLNDASALAYDSIHTDLYVSDTSNKNVSIFRIHVSKDGKGSPVQPVVISNTRFVQGLAYDPVSSSVFWTTGIDRTIMSAQLNENKTELAVGSVLHNFEEQELPYGIAVDSCKGTIYWTNCNVAKPSIESSNLNGNNKKVIISSKLFRPMAVAVSQADRLIYWVDEKAGNLFTVERCALDGSRRQIIVYSEDQQPLSLAVTGNRLFWTDDLHKSVWSVLHSSPELSTPMVETTLVKTYSANHAGGVITIYQDNLLDENACRNMIDLGSKVSSVVNVTGGTCLHGLATQTGGCLCAAGFTGIHCETSVCHNFCLNGGECFLDNVSAPVCKCPRPFTGARCEIDLCKDKCLNGGYCSVSPSGTSSVCHCTDNYMGDVCQIPRNICDHYCYKVATTQNYDLTAAKQCRCSIFASPINPLAQSHQENATLYNSRPNDGNKKWPVWSLGVTCFILFSICLVLSVVVYRLKGRPRLVRRYQVNPSNVKSSGSRNVGSTGVGAGGGDCEIAIENCCNMNICDTPCYEPEFRAPGRNAKSKKEEKCGLLPNMEVQPPDTTNDLF